MPRQTGMVVENNFRNGLITEASGLNFPENACTETWNCEFELDGSVRRRLGFEFENNHAEKTINRANQVVTSYLWKNVAGDGSFTLLVVQIGMTLYFYTVSKDDAYSQGALATSITMTTVPGADSVESLTKEAQFCDGNGFLFVNHPNMDPIRVSFDAVTNIATATSMSMFIRDFEGVAGDPYGIDTRPTSTLAGLNNIHLYNLYNQGWHTAGLTAWDAAQATMPSNADVMWRFKDSSDNLDFSTASLDRVISGNAMAPKGHFILDIAYQDKNTLIGTSGLPNDHQPGFERPSANAFFAGRLWMAGIKKKKFASKIYFSQLVERTEQYSWFFQQNDPTSETLFDLLPSDGGVIDIQEAGTIYKLVAVPGGLAVFAEKGVWFITGSSGIGFTATDYTVQKVALFPTISASSFVNVAGYPCWWNEQGIYLMVAQGNLPQIQSLTDGKIKSFYDEIPLSCKQKARGIWHYTDNHIRWIYRSEPTEQVTEMYEYDRVLNFNTLTGAFYPWTISDSIVKVNGIIVSDFISGNITSSQVVDNLGNDVVDGSGNKVVIFESSGSELSPFDKYIVSYPNAGTYQVSFADKISADYRDWFAVNAQGTYYDSYFITGYKIRGEGLRKWQNNWIRVYSRMSIDDIAYYIQGLWDYSTSGNTGRWSSQQYIEHQLGDYSTMSKRVKIRGHGLVLQLKVQNVEGMPFEIIGWTMMDSVNAAP